MKYNQIFKRIWTNGVSRPLCVINLSYCSGSWSSSSRREAGVHVVSCVFIPSPCLASIPLLRFVIHSHVWRWEAQKSLPLKQRQTSSLSHVSHQTLTVKKLLGEVFDRLLIPDLLFWTQTGSSFCLELENWQRCPGGSHTVWLTAAVQKHHGNKNQAHQTKSDKNHHIMAIRCSDPWEVD